MKFITPAFLLFLSFTTWAIPTLDPNKRTVCSMTLNSDEETEIFREQIAKDRAHYNPLVELTDFGGGDWFKKACQSGIRCDQLLISGHFTDRFGGTSAADGVRRSLKMDDMERMGCQNTCDGILDHPYEVFLLGCNTLATKAPDNRSPDEYLKHLLEEGVSKGTAELITEARYGRTGEDNRSRVERAFRGQRKMLYGFTARGPSGATIDRMLREYFQKKPLLTSLTRAQAMRTVGQVEALNTQLAQSLSLTAFAQCGAGGEDSERDTRICALRTPSNSIDRRISVIEDALTESDWIKYIPAINNFFRQNPIEKMTPAQKRAISQIGSNEVIGRQVRNLARTAKYPAVRAEWEFFGTTIGFINQQTMRPASGKDPIGDLIERSEKPKKSRLDGILDGI